MDTITSYMREFDEIAVAELSVPLRNLDHLCCALFCSRETLNKWIKSSPSFAASVDRGLILGEQKFRQMLSLLSLMPSSGVNTKLLSTMASDVYGITDNSKEEVADGSSDSIQFLKELSKALPD